jgi:hypothetical protein
MLNLNKLSSFGLNLYALKQSVIRKYVVLLCYDVTHGIPPGSVLMLLLL